MLIKNLISINGQLQKQVETLTLKVSELETRLGKNSSNSHLPPSSDGLKRKPAFERPTQKRGGKKGHKGDTLQMSEHVDNVVQLRAMVCDCGQSLPASEGAIVQRSQVHDIPPPRKEVLEFQVIEQVCSCCGRVHRGQLPDGIKPGAQYGCGVRGLSVLLTNFFQLSHDKTALLIKDLFDIEVNVSTLVSNNRLAYDLLQDTEQQVKANLQQSQVVHFDETGVRVAGKNHWLHTACNALWTYLFASTHRGGKAHESDVSFLSTFMGWAVHDCYGTYFTYDNCKHVLCIAHLLRELQAQIEQGKLWAGELKTFLMDLYQRTQKGTSSIPDIEAQKQAWIKLCRQAVVTEELLLPPPPPIQPDAKNKRGRKARGKALALLDRLILNKDAVLAFAQHDFIPFTNNQAERDLRPAKTKMKIAGCFRTVEGADTYARIQGFLSSCRKQQIGVFNELRALFDNRHLYVAPLGC